jgi:uncharacterized protein YecA (UPF0149 family)
MHLNPAAYPSDSTFRISCSLTLFTPKVGRNAPCPCGSGKKYKRCCGGAMVN